MTNPRQPTPCGEICLMVPLPIDGRATQLAVVLTDSLLMSCCCCCFVAGKPVTDHSLKPYYAWKLSPKVGFFMTDNRISRTIHR